MRNFYDGERFDFESENDNEDDPREGDVEINIEADIIGSMELDLVQTGLNQKLLKQAIKVASQDIFWWFRNPSTKMRRIVKFYHRFAQLVMLSDIDE